MADRMERIRALRGETEGGGQPLPQTDASRADRLARIRTLRAQQGGRGQGAGVMGPMETAQHREAESALNPADYGLPEGYTVTHTFADNGRADGGVIYRAPDGKEGVKASGYASTDPDTVARIKADESIREIQQGRLDRERIAAHPVAARANEAVRGVPFVGSWADEAVGLVSPQAAENMRLSTEAMEREKPWQTAALNIGGGLVGAGVGAGIVGGSTLANMGANLALKSPLSRVATTAIGGGLAGAAEGLAYGSGEGEGLERVGNALDGATIGGVLGGAFPIAGEALGGVVRGVKGLVRNHRVNRDLAEPLGVSLPAAQTLARVAEGMDADTARAAIARAGEGNGMLADAGPQMAAVANYTTRGIGEGVDEANRRLSDRAENAYYGVRDALQPQQGPRLAGPNGITEEIRERQRPFIRDAYDRAYNTPLDYADPQGAGNVVTDLINRLPASRRRAAINAAEELMQLEGKGTLQHLLQFDEAGELIGISPQLDVRTVDYITRGLQETAQTENARGGALGGKTQIGALLGNRAGEIRGVVREAVPDYDEALKLASNTIRDVEAVADGGRILQQGTTREEVFSMVDAAKAANDGGERLKSLQDGFLAQLEERMGNVRNIGTLDDKEARDALVLVRELNTDNMKAKIRSLFPDSSEEVLQRLDEAAVAVGTQGRASANSITAILESFKDDLTSSVRGNALAQGDLIGGAYNTVKAILGGSDAEVQARLGMAKGEIADLITRPNGLEILDMLLQSNARNPVNPNAGRRAREVTNALAIPAILGARHEEEENFSLPSANNALRITIGDQ